MQLSEEQYWLFASNGSTHELQEVMQLSIRNQLKLEHIDAVAYSGANDNTLIVLTCTSSDIQQGMNLLYATKSTAHIQLEQFIRTNVTAGNSSITGYGIGGALGLYYGATMDGLTGVVFDAPGISKLLSQTELDNLSICNIIGTNSLLPTIGRHPNNVRFADLPEKTEHKFAFDSAGNVRLGKPSELFRNMEKISSFDLGHNRKVRTLVQLISGIKDQNLSIAVDDDVYFYYALHQLDMNGIVQAIPDILNHYSFVLHQILTDWRVSVQEMLNNVADRQAEPLVQHSVLVSQHITEFTKSFYEDIESLMTIVMLQSMNRHIGLEKLESTMSKFAAELEERMIDTTNQLSQMLETIIMKKLEIRDNRLRNSSVQSKSIVEKK
ncbi:hypothetical protein I6N90_19865 [Paenibacillus sp. GSMTC-2017]|nr:hypothetical protein [Paenibacillus sp. GSMTC-2017]